ncbi:MAG TPA: C4-type zinc ribbon domain-containing protein [Blastocatellia bacterium]|nr:C4-type zinc ribbon domain-containing protein [Blastocatellia bacterium]
MSPELSQLIELQELDLEIQRVADRLSKIPVERDQTENEFRQYAAEFLALKSKHESILEVRKHLEAELATTQEHHNKYKQDLMRVRNEKEYTTALREIDATRKQISSLETEILKSMEEIEKLEAELLVRAPDVEKKRAEVDLSLGSLDREQEEAARQSALLSQRREQLSENLPRQLFATYDRMSRTRRGQALAEVRNGICTACRMKVRPKIFSDVRKGVDLVTCESCGRILYYKPTIPESVEAAKLD